MHRVALRLHSCWLAAAYSNTHILISVMFQRSPTGQHIANPWCFHDVPCVHIVNPEALQLLACNCRQQHPHANVVPSSIVQQQASTLQTHGGFTLRLACTLWTLRFCNCWLQLHTVTPTCQCPVKSNISPTCHHIANPWWFHDAPFMHNVVPGVRICWLAAA